MSDQDDIFYPNKFEHMMNYLSMEDCLLLNANYEMIDDKSLVLRGKRFNSPKRKSKICKLDFKKFIYNSNYPGFSIGIKHEIVNDFSKNPPRAFFSNTKISHIFVTYVPKNKKPAQERLNS